MKIRVKILIVCVFLPLYVFSQNYYWYRNKKIFLTPSDYQYLVIRDAYNISNLDTITQQRNIAQTPKEHVLYSGVVSSTELNKIDSSKIIYSIPSYTHSKSLGNIFISHYFYVKLKSLDDLGILFDYASQNNVTVEYNDDEPSLWYTLSSLDSDRNALEMANIFYESGLFEFSEPDFWSENELLSVNDPWFDQQWNLRNTGQHDVRYSGIDINYDSVRSIVSDSSNIVIAIFDTGVQTDHPDLAANILNDGYDADSNKSPNKIYQQHGTNCAGIIGAITNNNIGISGIFNGKLMPISHGFSYNHSNNTHGNKRKKRGIEFAAKNGADVISCSWQAEPSAQIDEAIEYALSYGRNGLGCVVVFASGNKDVEGVAYPANSREEIIVVGAASPCGERKSKSSCDGDTRWGSNYGKELDIVAPGVLIPTTDLIGQDGASSADYISDFWGTSAACPHVAAIAGLILSVNPQLTAKQVADIIESTAQKVGGYDYHTTNNRPNGIWNDSVGYGLVDAYAAVLAAKITTAQINGPEILSNQSTYSVTNIPTNASITWTYTYTPDIANTPTHLEPITFVNGNSTSSVLIKREKYLPTDIEIGPIIPEDTITIELATITPSIQPRYFTGTVVLKATITSGGYTYVMTKTINLPSSDTEELHDNEVDIIIDSWVTPTEKTNILNENSLSPYQLTYKNPVTSKGTTVSIEYLSDLRNEYIPYNGNSTIEIWHHQLGLVKRLCDTTSNLYLDCGDLPTGVYQMILIINGEPVAQSKLIKL